MYDVVTFLICIFLAKTWISLTIQTSLWTIKLAFVCFGCWSDTTSANCRVIAGRRGNFRFALILFINLRGLASLILNSRSHLLARHSKLVCRKASPESCHAKDIFAVTLFWIPCVRNANLVCFVLCLTVGRTSKLKPPPLYKGGEGGGGGGRNPFLGFSLGYDTLKRW